MTRYLLDTNTCIEIMRANRVAVQKLAAVVPSDCAISTVTTYELYTGVERCANPAQERSKVALLLQTVSEIPFDTHAAQEAARVRALLESQGQTIGPYDLLLAGQALALSLVLVTANTREFSRVPHLTLDNWQV